MTEHTEYKAAYEYTPSFARRAFLVAFLHRCWAHVAISVVAVVIGILGLNSSASFPTSCFLFGIVLVLWSSWVGGLHAAGRAAAELPDRTMRVTLTDEACNMQSCFITSSLRWQGIKAVHRRRNVLVIYRSGSRTYTPIPVAALSEGALDFFMRKAREAGARVR